MKRKVRAFPFEVRSVSEAGEFEGYLSVYDKVDYYREVVVPGAFRESLEEWAGKGRLPPILWQHRAGEPLGPFLEMREDDVGLYVKGQLLVAEVQRAREARALLKAGAIGGMSIGFDVVEDDYDSRAGIRSLKRVNLWEGSIVTFPANEAAQVVAVKGWDGDLPSMSEFEDFLREAGGFSRSQAKAIAGHGLGKLLREAGGEAANNGSAVDVKSLLADVRVISLIEELKL
jgi:HK97 family phage prohead protease